MPGPHRRGGWRYGLVAVLAAAVILALLYLTADRIASAVPALQPALTGYVSFIEAAAEDLTAWISSLQEFLADR